MNNKHRKDLMVRAWRLKRKKPFLSFQYCLKWSWKHTGLVFQRTNTEELEDVDINNLDFAMF